MRFVRNPHRRQFTRAQQAGQLKSIPPIRLDPIARPPRDQRRRNNTAFMTQLDDLPMQPIAGRPSLITEMKLGMPFRQLGDHPTHRCRVGVNLAKNRTSPSRPLSAIATA